MAEVKTFSDLKNISDPIVKYWGPRNEKMKEWYKLIQMKDELAKDNMESFVGNDPRSSFNLILHMLDEKIPHRIPTDLITPDTLEASSIMEGFLSTAWHDVFKAHRRKGMQSWMRTFLGFMLATGWVSVFAQVTPDGKKCMAEVWNPATVYQNWDDELVQCVHKYRVQPMQAAGLIRRNKWNVPIPQAPTDIIDLWYLDDGGKVHNVISLGNDIAKADTIEPRFKTTLIPIVTFPVGGLPDNGILGSDSNDFIKEVGQSIVATNENIYRSWNKWWTFSMQLLRDTAQPRWWEKSRSSNPILKAADIFKRGAIFRMGPEDSIGALEVPPIPVEIRGNQLDMEAMMERGGVSWAAQGNFRGQLTSYVMAQVIASTAQVARPFHQATKDALADIDNLWLTMIKESSANPYGFTWPSELNESIEVTADYEVKIPGDLMQRATTAKMLDPEFKLSKQFITTNLFPEIRNPVKEQALVRADDAAGNEVNAMIALITHFRREEAAARKIRDNDSANLFAAAASHVENQMKQVLGGGMQPRQAAPPPGVPTTVSPPNIPRIGEEQYG